MMKYLKRFEGKFSDIDPWDEEDWDEYEEGTFIYWLKKKYPQEDVWDEINFISCSHGDIMSLKGLGKLKNLRTFYCHRNELKDLSTLEVVPFIQLVSFSQNKLTSIEGIEKLKYCHTLSLNENLLENLKGIEKMEDLQEFNCYGNPLKNTYGLENLTSLRKLCLEDNRLTEIYGIENIFRNLEQLFAKGNNFSYDYKRYLSDLFRDNDELDFRL